MSEKEIWKQITGYEGLYEVSNLYRVRSLDRVVHGRLGNAIRRKGKILKFYTDDRGYSHVALCKNGKSKMYRKPINKHKHIIDGDYVKCSICKTMMNGFSVKAEYKDGLMKYLCPFCDVVITKFETTMVFPENL